MTFVQRISRRTPSRRVSSRPRSLAGVYAPACQAWPARGELRNFLVRALPAKNEPFWKMSRFPLYRNCATFVSSCLCNIGLTLSLLLRPSGRRFDSQVAQNEAMNVANAVRWAVLVSSFICRRNRQRREQMDICPLIWSFIYETCFFPPFCACHLLIWLTCTYIRYSSKLCPPLL